MFSHASLSGVVGWPHHWMIGSCCCWQCMYGCCDVLVEQDRARHNTERPGTGRPRGSGSRSRSSPQGARSREALAEGAVELVAVAAGGQAPRRHRRRHLARLARRRLGRRLGRRPRRRRRRRREHRRGQRSRRRTRRRQRAGLRAAERVGAELQPLVHRVERRRTPLALGRGRYHARAGRSIRDSGIHSARE